MGSCRAFLPTLMPSLEGVEVVSARTTYESLCVRSPTEWKRLAFSNEIGSYYGQHGPWDRFRNIISLGDSLHEKLALFSATEGIMLCRTKFVKFTELPSVG